jgi:outer membrane protein assembly factor BamA
MNKKLLAGLVSALLATSASAFDPFPIKDIRVEGIQRTEAGTVFSYLPVKVGDTMTDEKAAAAIKVLFATVSSRTYALKSRGRCWWWCWRNVRQSLRSSFRVSRRSSPRI